MKAELSRERSRAITVCKTMAMLMVVIIHAYNIPGDGSDTGVFLYAENYFSQVITRSAVPLFFTISAFLLYRRDFDYLENIRKKLRSLGIPYMLCNAVWLAVFAFFCLIPAFSSFFSKDSSFLVSEYSLVDWLNAFFCFREGAINPFLGQFWFLKDLIILNCLSKVISFLVRKVPYIILPVLAVLLFTKTGIPYPFNLFNVSIHSIFFFVLGCAVAEYYPIFRKIISVRFSVAAPIYGILSVADLFNINGFDDGGGVTFGFYPLHIITIIAGMLFWYGLSCIIVSKYEKAAVFIEKLAPYSFFIYAFHEYTQQFTMKLIFKVIPKSGATLFAAYLTVPVIVTASVYGLGRLINHCFPKVYRLLTGNRS